MAEQNLVFKFVFNNIYKAREATFFPHWDYIRPSTSGIVDPHFENKIFSCVPGVSVLIWSWVGCE